MRILSIDPGYAILGFGIIDVDTDNRHSSVVSYGVVTTEKETPFPARLHEIAQSIDSLICKYSPDEIAMERLFFAKNQTTGTYVSEIRGALLYIAEEHKLTVYQYTPLEIKLSITSYGKGTKKQVQEMIMRCFSLDTIPKPDDAADALACGLTHIIKKHNIL